jgi:hypothetical protein
MFDTTMNTATFPVTALVESTSNPRKRFDENGLTGIGACAAIFSLVNAVLIRSLPYGDSGRLVYLYTPNPRYNLPPENFAPAYRDFYDIKRESRSFQRITAFD